MAKINGTNGAYDSITNNNLNTQRAAGMPDQVAADGKHALAIATTNVSIWSNNMKIGFVQSASPSENRSITKVQALGVEGVVQSVPGNTNGGQISLSRLAVYNSNLFNALGLSRTGGFAGTAAFSANNSSTQDAIYKTYSNPFKTLKDQRVPIEIKIVTNMPNSVTNQTIEEIYLDCWLSSYSKSIASSTITITEQATIQYSDVIVVG